MKKETIVANTMREFKEGKLRSSNGDKVTDRDQAIAIALSKSGQSKFDEGGSVEDIADAITGAKTLLKFASASDKKEIETFIKGLEILKKMSSEPKTQQADKKKPLAPDSKTKKEEFVSTPIKEGQIYFDAPRAKPGYYNNRVIKSISGKYATVQATDVINGEARPVGNPYTESVEYIQNLVDQVAKEKFDKDQQHKKLVETILDEIDFNSFKGGDLNSFEVQKDLLRELNNLKTYANKWFSTSDRTQSAGYYGSTQMYSTSQGDAINLSFNNIHRGGYYGFDRPYFVNIQIGGALEREPKRALEEVAEKMLEKYTYESDFGKSKVGTSSGTAYSSVFLISPSKNSSYRTIPFLSASSLANIASETPKKPKSESKPKKPAPKKNTPKKNSLQEAKVYFQQEFDTTPEEDDLIKALINSDKSQFRTEKELEAEEYFSKTKFEDEFDNHIKTLIEYSKKKPSKNSKSSYTLDEAKKFFIESGKIDEVSPDTERLIRALLDQDKSPIRTEDELYAEKSLLPNITNWSEDWKYHITNLISLSKNKKGEFPKSEKRYTYALTIRPFDIGTYPKENFVRFVYEEEEDYKFGLLEYSEPIPDRDLKHYSLAPVSELNQYNEKLFDYFDGNIGQAFIKKTPGNIPYVKVDLYDDPNEEAIETIDLSGQEFLNKIKSGDYKILENQSKIKDTDGENNFKKKQSLENIKNQIIDFVEKNSWFRLDDDSDDFMLFATRENGNVGSESPGSKDIAEAKRLKSEIEKKFKDLVKIELEVVDEWVHINIDILRNKFSKGGSIRKMGLYDSVLYNDKQYSISEKDGVIGLKNLSRGAWGSDYPFIPLNEVDINEVTDMYGNKVEISNKFESGGVIGQEIVFDDNGEENKGVIKDIHEITGDYIVATEDGRTVLASKELDVISLGAMRKKPLEAARKRFGFFEKGGSVSKYEIVEGYDHYKNIPLYRVTDRDEYVGDWHSNRFDAEKELSGLKNKFNDGGLPESHRFYVRSNFGHWSVTDSINNKMIVGYSSKEDAYKTANGLNQIRDAYQLEKTINLLQTQQGYGHFLNKYADGGNVRGMDWYQMWQPKQNKVVKVGDIVVHQHSKQPYKIIELLDDQYTVAKLDGNKEVEWKTFYEDFENHKMFMPQQFGSGGTTLSQYIWNNHDLMIKGRYKVTGDVEAEVVVGGWEVGGSGKDEYLSMYQPSLEQNPEIMSLIVKRPNLRKMSNGIVVPATTSTGKKVKIQRIGGIYLKNDGQPY